MTQADKVAEILAMYQQRGDPDVILSAIRRFFDDFSGGPVRLKSLDISKVGDWTLSCESSERCSNFVLRYMPDRNAWYVSGQKDRSCTRLSDYDAMASLGWPREYLEGFKKAIALLAKSYLEHTTLLGSAKEAQRTVRTKKQELRKLNDALHASNEDKIKSEVQRRIRHFKLKATSEERRARKAMYKALDMIKHRDYPRVPTEEYVHANATGEGVPEICGVYFVWEGDIVAYIGQSINLQKRLRTVGHNHVRDGDRVSWLEFSEQDLDFAESFYIGICRPHRNFGRERKWKQ